MKESFLNDKGELIPREEWKSFINSLKTDKIINDKEKAKQLIKEQLTKAIKSRATGKYGVLFSGGIDSVAIALILKKLGKSFTCYSVGLKGSKDLESAEKISKALDLQLRTKVFELSEIEDSLKKVTKTLKGFDYVNTSVGTVLYEAINLAKKDNINILFTGLGSEEIFAGYHKHTKAKDINEACWQGVVGIWKKDLERDYTIAKALNVELRTPFLDKELIKAAMMIPGELKISKGYKKMILREVLIDLGLEKKYAMRKKLAAQYGSKFDKAIKKIAKCHGYKYKSDYVKNIN